MHRSTKLSFLLLTCPLLACGDDDVPQTPDSSSSDDGTESTDAPTTITPTDTDPDTTADDGSSSGTSSGTTTDDPSTTSSSSSGEEDSTTTSGGGVCGDDALDRGEQCDGAQLDGMDCIGLGMGFGGGTLECADDCTFDTAGCFSCGNELVEGTEQCDGTQLGGATCESEGFVNGRLACAPDCTFDITGCGSCGDDVIDMGEQCDGMALGGATCASEGFVDGTLACAPDCSFDTAGCTTCGNGVVDMGEACDGMDLAGQGCADLGMGFTGGALACDPACGYDPAGCTSIPWPVGGEVIVTEIMQNPSVLNDADGEWFELYNPMMGASYQLGSCIVEGGAMGETFTIDTDLVIGPQEYLTFAIDGMVDPGFAPDFVWPGGDFNLSNSSDTLRLVCNGVTVDEVVYDDGATFPDPNGQSMNLDPMAYDAVANDDGTNWCGASTSYNGDFGTPGADNTECMGMVSYSIDFCRLQFPETIAELEGSTVDVYGRLFIAGLTDLSGVNDPAPEVIGTVGYGPDATDPAVDPGWTWSEGVPNPTYDPAAPGYEPNNDEYVASLSVPSPPGDYDYAFRFSGDGGTTFTYCDGQPAGSSDGYQVANAGQMTSQPGGPPPVLYFSEYAEGSSNNKALEIFNANGGDVDLSACTVRIYANGAVMPSNTINLVGTLPAGSTYVVCDNDIAPAVFDPSSCDLLDPGSFYNGNDAVALSCGADTLDVIGQIGFNPGAAWSVGGVTTLNATMRRSCMVTAGDPNGADVFDPSLEWTGLMSNDFSDFGQYMCP